MEYGLPASAIAEIRKVFYSSPLVDEVIVFGSRAMGNYKPGSDIDLAILGDNFTFDDLLALYMRIEKLELLYKFDLQNFVAWVGIGG